MQTRYRGLRFVGLLLKIIGVAELIVGLVSVILLPLVFSDSRAIFPQFGLEKIFPASGLLIGILSGLFIFLCGLVCGLLTFSAGELFNVVIAIEQNTRTAVQLLQKQKEPLS